MAEPDLSQCFVAFPGEQIVCPDCYETLATLTGNWTGDIQAKRGSAGSRSVIEVHPPAFLAWTGPEHKRQALWCACGGAPTRPLGYGYLPDAPGARIFLRSGAWTGWRALGGE